MENAPINLLRRNWGERLSALVKNAERSLVICSPYVTTEGIELLTESLSQSFQCEGSLLFVTDLSTANMMQGSTDPGALQHLSRTVSRCSLRHLPRLHAKVYVSDDQWAVITSGNLTAGGLFRNYEYGVELFDHILAKRVSEDITSYAELGALVSPLQLNSYCEAAKSVREAFHHQQASTRQALRRAFESKLRSAEDELIRIRLGGGPMHTVFAKTILYLLGRHGPLPTPNLHLLIESIHPDLCDNTVDRVIDGKRFGKKWKHAVRNAQQNLKGRGLVELRDGLWFLQTGT